jgi:starch-binding outer membrane protein SusE/F
MKLLIIYFSLLIVLPVFYGCNDDDPEVTIPVITAVELRSFPSDDTFVQLDPQGTDSVKIYWQRSGASDGTLVMYSVQFDKVDGDFSKPVGAVVTDSVGLAKRARIIHKTLNIFAENAGIEPLSIGKLKWRVVASNGVAASYSDSHTIEVARPVGIAEMPTNVYLTGDATEAGANATKGILLKKLSAGVYEIYTSLTAGTYKFVNSITTAPVSFFIEGEKIRKSSAARSPASTKKLYHIQLDFNTATATISEVLSVGLWHGASSDVIHELAYQNNGTWSISNITPFTTGVDDHYKFRMTKKASDGSLSDIFWGSAQVSNTRPTSATALSYYYLNPSSDFSQYDYSYKFSTASENKAVDINFTLTSSVTYTHKITIR